MADDKRCGTCCWWKQSRFQDQRFRREYGECTFPLPSAYEKGYIVFSESYEGTTCPCWQRKEEDKSDE